MQVEYMQIIQHRAAVAGIRPGFIGRIQNSDYPYMHIVKLRTKLYPWALFGSLSVGDTWKVCKKSLNY